MKRIVSLGWKVPYGVFGMMHVTHEMDGLFVVEVLPLFEIGMWGCGSASMALPLASSAIRRAQTPEDDVYVLSTMDLHWSGPIAWGSK